MQPPSLLYSYKLLIIGFLAAFLAACSDDDDPTTYRVTFDTDGGEPKPATQTIEQGKTAAKPPTDPTKRGYTFDDWYTDSTFTTTFDFANTSITADTEVFAQFTINAYTVSFDTDDGSSVADQDVAYNDKATRPLTDPTKTGYTFNDWYTDNTFATAFDFANTAITADTEVFAKFTVNTHAASSFAVIKELEAVAGAAMPEIPQNKTSYLQETRYILNLYAAGTPIKPLYATPDGAGKKDGSSLADAAAQIKGIIDTYTPDNASTVYFVFVEPGAYDAGSEMAMKNNVAIIAKPGAMLSGNAAHCVFANANINRTALLYGAAVTNGRTNGVATASNAGAGMYNNNSSPTLINVTFSNNNAAATHGGGMYNRLSSPMLINVTFSGNSAGNANAGFRGGFGGGMYNVARTTVTLINGTFDNNSTHGPNNDGGAIYNFDSQSTITLINTTLYNNHANSGGGLAEFESGTVTAINTIFWGNTKQQFASGNVSFYNSVVQNGSGNSVISADPKLGALGNHGGLVQTAPIEGGSSAIDKGLYVKINGNTLYYSEDGAAWFSDPNLQSSATPPASAQDILDARGYGRNGRPDIGAYEYNGAAP